MRYIVSEIPDKDVEHTITRTKIAHILSSSRDTTITGHDILIVASILYKTDTNLIEQFIQSNYDDLDTDTKRVYNMYWSDIVKAIKQRNNKYHKILNDADYLTTASYTNVM